MQNQGYTYIPELISRVEVEKYRKLIFKKLSYNNESTRFVSNKILLENDEFWDLFVNDKLLLEIRKLLGNEDIFYIPHTDVHINNGAGQLHRDCANREFGKGSDWDHSLGQYGVVRVAIYLSDYKDSGSSLYVIPGSNENESRLAKTEIKIFNKIVRLGRNISSKIQLPHITIFSKGKKLKFNAGDCVIFDQRLIHAGGGITLKQPKVSLFFAYGLRNSHSNNHINFLKEAAKKSLNGSYSLEIPKKLEKKLKEYGINQ